MARSKFEVIYSDGRTRKEISSAERNSLLLSREIKQIGPTRYKFVGQAKTFHAFADLGELIQYMALPPSLLRHYLDALRIIFELALERELQLEETPEAFAIRLEEMGAVSAGDVLHPEVQKAAECANEQPNSSKSKRLL